MEYLAFLSERIVAFRQKSLKAEGVLSGSFPAPKGAVCARPFGPLRGNILTKKTRYSILEDPPAPKGAVCASLGFAKEQLAKPIDNTTCLPRRGTRNNWLCQ